VQFGEIGRRLSKPLPVPGEWRPANPAPIGRTIGAGSTSTATILDFVHARSGTSTAQIHQAPSNENPDSMTLIEFVAITGLLLTTAFFYPTLVWFLLLS